VLDYAQLSIGVGGTSRMTLQSALVRKYVNYDEASRSTLSRGDLVNAVTRDAPALSSAGYGFIFELARSLSSIAVMTFFVFASPVLFHKKGVTLVNGIGILVLFPTVLLAVLVLRKAKNLEYLEKSDDAFVSLTSRATSISDNIDLCRDYNKREEEVETFQARVKAFNKADSNKNKTLLNSGYFAPWLAILVVACFIPFRGVQVIEGASLGMFLANLKIIGKYGKAWGHIYSLFLKRQTAFPSMANIRRLLNLQTDLPQLMELTRGLTKETLKGIRGATLQYTDSILDLVPIKMENLTHTYTSELRPSVTLNINGKLDIQQGTLVSLIGPVGDGKSTVLRLMSMRTAPEHISTGSVYFIPSHLRVLNIASRPVFFRGGLLENLTYGVMEGHPDGRVERVRTICGLVGLGKEIVNLVQEDTECTSEVQWSHVVSDIQARLLSLVRAFVANPEILCMDKPVLGFPSDMKKRVLRVLKEHYVNGRGVVQDPNTRERRRCRTCILSHTADLDPEIVDVSYEVTRQGIRKKVHTG
jgi:ABC-type multidrug transport system fused ATPase/permease subunit